MTSLVLETLPVATDVAVTDDKLIVDLEDGRGVAVPLGCYPRLLQGSATERSN